MKERLPACNTSHRLDAAPERRLASSVGAAGNDRAAEPGHRLRGERDTRLAGQIERFYSSRYFSAGPPELMPPVPAHLFEARDGLSFHDEG